MNSFLTKLEEKIDLYIKNVYLVTQNFPKSEMYGLTSQYRRSAVSVMLNFVEGYARFKSKVYVNFLEISYGSLKESEYITKLSKHLGYIDSEKYIEMQNLNAEIAAMLHHTIKINRKNPINP